MSAEQLQFEAGERPKRRRQWLLRLAAVGFGLLLFVVAEAVCWLFGWGGPEVQEDPFVGFSDLQPLFVYEPAASEYHVAPARLKFFVEESFAAVKRSGTVRIFCLGGSTVQGRPFAKETSFTTWLELALRQADPSREWEVINCGGVSYASYRLVPIMEECLRYEPDLFIVCTGHNEFLEDRTYGAIRDQSAWWGKPHQYLARLRSYQVYRRFLLSWAGRAKEHPQRFTLGSDVDALLDYRDGTRAYHRDEQWREGVIEHYGCNVARMVTLAREAGVPLVFILPPSNLADTPPFKSEHGPGLTADVVSRFRALWDEARVQTAAGQQRAIALCEAARALDPRHAGLRFHLGKLYEHQGRFEEARAEFLAAREQDICPLRIVQPMEETLRRVARQAGVPLLDAHQLLEARTDHGILDNSMLVDHIHPSIEGHKLIALALVDTLVERGLVTARANGRDAARRAFRQYQDTLPMFYFVRGQQRLHSLREWSRGRADGPPIQTRFPERFGTQDSGPSSPE